MKNITSLISQGLKTALAKYAFAVCLFLAFNSNAQVGIITTVAGGGGVGIPADSTSLNWPQGLARDASGNIYIADA